MDTVSPNKDGIFQNGYSQKPNRINQHLASLDNDFLYHIGVSPQTHDLKTLFGDVKFVLLGGQGSRMMRFAQQIATQLGVTDNKNGLTNHAGSNDRYVLYKAGPVLCISHGIGAPSLSIIFHETMKLLHYAQCEDLTFIRVGTSGGIGLEAGSVVVTERVVDGTMESNYEMKILGKRVLRPAVVDRNLVEEIRTCSDPNDTFKVVLASTMCADDFYESQARIDGAFCDYSEADRKLYLKRLYDSGVRNIEMESLSFLAMCHHAGIKGAVVCVVLLDRMKSEEPDNDFETLHAWQDRPLTVILRYIKKKLNKQTIQ